MRIRVTTEFEVSPESKFQIAAKVEQGAADMAAAVTLSDGVNIISSNVTFPRGPKEVAEPAKKPAAKK